MSETENPSSSGEDSNRRVGEVGGTDGLVFMANRMMQNLQLREGGKPKPVLLPAKEEEEAASAQFKPFTGAARRLDGIPVTELPKEEQSIAASHPVKKEEEPPEFKPFTGQARRLDEEPVTELPPPSPSLDESTGANGVAKSNFRSRKRPGNLMADSDDLIEAPKKLAKYSKEDANAETVKKE